MKYRKGYKYQLAETETFQTSIKGVSRRTEFIDVTPEGLLTIRAGYAWDGASGPTMDTKSSMRASLLHDALYQMIRQGCLEKTWRAYADEEFGRLLEEDGMWSWRAAIWVKAVQMFASAAADPKNTREVFTAP